MAQDAGESDGAEHLGQVTDMPYRPILRRVDARRVLPSDSSIRMARPTIFPPSKLISTKLTVELIEALDDYARGQGITKREVLERALAREIGIQREPRLDRQIQLQLEADEERRAS